MDKWTLAKDVGKGLLVGAVATGLVRGFDNWVAVAALCGVALLLAVAVRHKFKGAT